MPGAELAFVTAPSPSASTRWNISACSIKKGVATLRCGAPCLHVAEPLDATARGNEGRVRRKTRRHDPQFTKRGLEYYTGRPPIIEGLLHVHVSVAIDVDKVEEHSVDLHQAHVELTCVVQNGHSERLVSGAKKPDTVFFCAAEQTWVQFTLWVWHGRTKKSACEREGGRKEKKNQSEKGGEKKRKTRAGSQGCAGRSGDLPFSVLSRISVAGFLPSWRFVDSRCGSVGAANMKHTQGK